MACARRFGEVIEGLMILLQFPNRDKNSDKGNALIQTNRLYLSTEEVAQLFGFSVRTITEWAAQWQDSGGQQGLPAFKMGRSWRFDREQIQAMVRSKQIPLQSVERKTASA